MQFTIICINAICKYWVHFYVEAFRIVQLCFNRPLIVDRFCARQVVDLFGLYEIRDSATCE
jgi:hypothetical protein